MQTTIKRGDPHEGLRARRLVPAGCILLIAILLCAPIVPILDLGINNVPQVYLPENAPAVEIDKEIRSLFPNDQGMAFLFEGPDIYGDQFLSNLEALTASLERLPRVQKVLSVTRQEHIEANEDGFSVEALLGVGELERWNIGQRRNRALNDRFGYRALVGLDGNALALVVIPESIDDSFERMALQADVHRIVREHKLQTFLVAEAGLITTDVEQTREFLRQLALFMPLTVLIGLLLLWILFGRGLAVVLGLAVIGAVVGPTVAIYSVLSLPFNLISSILPPLLCALTIAALVHLFTGIKLAARRGLTGEKRVNTALDHIRRPALYSALTTMAGFAALGLSDIRPISHLGLITAVGVGLIYVVVFHISPPVIARWDKKGWGGSNLSTNLSDRAIRALFHTGTRKPIATLLIATAVLGVGAPFVSRIIVETNLLEFFAPNHEVRRATEKFESTLAGTGSIDILITSQEYEGLTSPQVLSWMKKLGQWAESQTEVDAARSFADYIEEMHWAFSGGSDADRVIPDNAPLISQYLFVYDGRDLYDFVNQDFTVARIHLNLNVHGATLIDEFLLTLREELGRDTPEGIDWEVAGLGRMFSDQVALLINGQIRSIIGALAIIFVLMLLEWRSVKDTLVCLLPNFAPVLLIFILMGIFGIWLDVATAMIASVAVGIAIDDTIHIFHGFISRVRRGVSPVVAIARTYHNAGRAVLTTTIILCGQFSILVVSNFVPIKHFGLLASTGLFAALIFDLLLLPAILMLVYGRKNSRTKVLDLKNDPLSSPVA